MRPWSMMTVIALLASTTLACQKASRAPREGSSGSTARARTQAHGSPNDVRVTFRQDSAGYHPVIALRQNGAWHTATVDASLPSTPTVSVSPTSAASYLILLTLNELDLNGGVLVSADPARTAIVYSKWSPEGRVCAPPTLATVDGETVLVENLAALFPPSECTSGDDCVWQIPSTWPRLLAVSGDSMVDVSTRHRGFYQEQARVYLRARDRVRAGLAPAGEAVAKGVTIASQCGAWIPDSLAALAVRARNVGGS